MSTEHCYQTYKKGVGKSRKIRTIDAPTPLLKRKQRELLFELEGKLNVSNYAFAYRTGLSNPCKACLEVHAGNDTFVRLDIEDFFRSIKAGQVFNLLVGSGFSYDKARQVVALSCVKNHLAFGSALSPLLANAYLFAFDQNIAAALSNAGFAYSRYSDDLYLSSYEYDVTTARLFTAISKVDLALRSYGLRLNASKIQYNPKFVLGIDRSQPE